MKFLAALFHKNTAFISILIVVLGVCISCSNTPEIVVPQMKMELQSGKQLFKEELLPGEIADTKIEHIAYVGPTVQKVQLSDENISIFFCERQRHLENRYKFI